MTVNEQVKSIMRSRNMTQQQVADLLGVERVYVTRMLSGDVGQITGRWGELLAALGLRLVVEEVPEAARGKKAW